MNNNLVVFLGGSAAFLTGIFSGWHLLSEPSSPSSVSPAVDSAKAVQSEPVNAPIAETKISPRSEEEVVTAPLEARRQRLVDAVAAGSITDLPALAADFNADEIESALAAISRIPLEKRFCGTAVLLARWGMLDGANAFAYAKAMQAPALERRAAWCGAIRGWAASDPQSAERAVLQITDEVLRSWGIIALATELSGKSPERAMALIKSLPVGTEGEAVLGLLRDMAERDPVAALRVAGQSTNSSEAINAVAEVWARHDPKAAWTWAVSHADFDARKVYLAVVARAWCEDDPQAAANALAGAASLLDPVASGVKPSRFSQSFSPEIQLMYDWTSRDWKAALDWVKALPDRKAKYRILRDRITDFLEQDSKGFLTSMTDEPPSPERDKVIRASIKEWSRIDPAAAVAWARQIQDPALRDEVLPALAGAAATFDAKAGLQLLGEASYKTADKARAELLSRWSRSDPAAAAAWVINQPETPQREQLIETAMENFYYADKTAAQAWVRTLPQGKARATAERRLERLSRPAKTVYLTVP